LFEFTALDVEEGDSFLIKKHDKVILIDGGKDSSNSFTEKIKSKKINNIDLIVCTHADTDHSEGLINLLKSNYLKKCNMIWMPAIWKKHIQLLKEKNQSFILDLIEEVKKENDIANEVIEGFINVNEIDAVRNKEGFTKASPRENLTLNYIYNNGSKKFHFNYGINFVDSFSINQFCLIRKALHTYGKLLELIEVASVKRIPITWFDLVESPLTHKDYFNFKEDGLLTPLCHRPITVQEINNKPNPDVLGMLRKGDVNKESIVLASKKDTKLPLVIISSDSDFELIKWMPSSEEMLITVPHHGSSRNSEAIQKCISLSSGKNLKYIRGDSSRISISNEFLTLKNDFNTFCTICREWNIPKRSGTKVRQNAQSIDVYFENNKLRVSDNSRPCKCRRKCTKHP